MALSPQTRKLLRAAGLSQLDRYLRRRYTGNEQPPFARYGSYYSPFPDLKDVQRRAGKLFAKHVVDLGPSINLRTDEQKALLREVARYHGEFDWPQQPSADRRFYLENPYFCIGDALVLYGFLRHFKPRRVIEIGSGFSSALMVDTDEQFLGNLIDFVFVDPESERVEQLLRPQDSSQVTVIKSPVQDLSLETFDKLGRGDFLFIDSSHVVKVGSDVNYLLFEVLPRLTAGVIVHFHDIMWPFEYPKQWFEEGRAWNEAYAVRAFLQYNDAFQILLFNNYAGYCLTELVQELMPRFLENKGGSLWLRKAT